MKILISILFLLLNHKLIATCSGYPCDTLWYDENGKLNDYFVAKEVRFELGRTDLQTFDSYHNSDSIFILSMYYNLDSLANAIISDGGIFEIQIHSDSRASNNCCSKPSQSRSESVVRYLVSKGVPPDRLIPKGFGETVPRMVINDENKTLLTEAYINRFRETNPAEFERLHQLNRRLVVKRLI